MNTRITKVDPDFGNGHVQSEELGIGRSGIERFAWLPIPVLFAAIIVARVTGFGASYEAPTLRIILSFTFYTLVALGALVLIGRSFLATGAPGLLLLECGLILWSLAGTVGDIVSSGDANINITIFNTAILLSGICLLAGAILSTPSRSALRNRRIWLGAGLRDCHQRDVLNHMGSNHSPAASVFHPRSGRHSGSLLGPHFGHRHVCIICRPVISQPASDPFPIYSLVCSCLASTRSGVVRYHDPVVTWKRRELVEPHGTVARWILSIHGRLGRAAMVRSGTCAV